MLRFVQQWCEAPPTQWNQDFFNFMGLFGIFAVANPGFSRGGTNSQSVDPNLLFCIFLAENCIKMKEFEP